MREGYFLESNLTNHWWQNRVISSVFWKANIWGIITAIFLRFSYPNKFARLGSWKTGSPMLNPPDELENDEEDEPDDELLPVSLRISN